MKRLYISLSLIAFSVVAALVFGPMLRNGMFLDGLVYTNIAKNLSSGIGDVWHPLVTKYGEVFFEQPPLLPWLESGFFRLFGDGIHTEDLFNFFVFSGTVVTMFQIWKQLTARENWPLFVWPLLFWVLAAINGERVENIAGSRFDFIGLLLMANLPSIGIGLLVWLFFGRGRRCKESPESRVGWSFVVVGLLAVLPLVISIKQAAYYQLPALPFFALGFGLLLLEPCRLLMGKLSAREGLVKGILAVSILGALASSVFALSMLGTTDRRDVAIIESAQNIAKALKSAGHDGYNLKILGANRWAGEKTAYPLTAYLARLNDVHLNQRSAAPATVYLLTDGTAKPPVGEVLWREEGIWVVGISFD